MKIFLQMMLIMIIQVVEILEQAQFHQEMAGLHNLHLQQKNRCQEIFQILLIVVKHQQVFMLVQTMK